MLNYVLALLGSIFCLSIALFFLVFYYDFKWLLRKSDVKKINRIPGPRPLPIFGNIFMFMVPDTRKYTKLLISRGGPVPRSPDLNPLHFCLWSHAKSLVYTTDITTREELQHRILDVFQQMRNDPELLESIHSVVICSALRYSALWNTSPIVTTGWRRVGKGDNCSYIPLSENLVVPPLVAITAATLSGMLSASLCRISTGMRRHSSCNMALSWTMEVGRISRNLNRRSNLSQRITYVLFLIMTFIYPSELSKVFLRLHKEYGPTFRLWIQGFPEVFITDPEDVEVSAIRFVTSILASCFNVVPRISNT
ncbi:hypothetical protein ANN_01558 [Periplaneta americana]|uniref:Cytochrome P450 n=1 Tax=Periplaneta americana TaxID=6978 RepID=A0ABQ8TWB1_PERAM|nr:hypothetical protein ANN_01558 [Periplaneta americana]